MAGIDRYSMQPRYFLLFDKWVMQMQSFRGVRRIRNRRLSLENLELRRVFTVLISDGLFLQPATREVQNDAAVVNVNSLDNQINPLANDYWQSWYPLGDAPIDTIDTRPVSTSASLWLDGRIQQPVSLPSLSILSVSGPNHGSVEISPNGQSVKYTPNSGFEGIDNFTYIVSGIESPNNVGTVFLNVVQPLLGMDDWFHSLPGSNSQSLDVLNNDRSNVAQSQSNYRVPTYVLTTDSRVLPIGAESPSNLKSIVSVTMPDRGGSVRIADDRKSLIYAPNANYTGVETFGYRFEDADGYQGEASVSVRVDARTKPPAEVGVLWPEQIPQLRRQQIIDGNTYLLGMPNQFGYYPTTYYGGWWDDRVMFMANTAGIGTNLSLEMQSDNTSSDTNNQISGVDEGDIVESDGRYLYLFSNSETVRELAIIDTLNSVEPAVVSRLQLDGELVAQHLLGDRLAVITRRVSEGGQVTSKMSLIDIADRANPTVMRSTVLNSNFQQSRVIGDKLYVFSQLNMLLPQAEQVGLDDDSTIRFYETGRQLLARLSENLFDGALPTVANYDAAGVLVSQFTDTSSAASIVQVGMGYSLEQITSFDLDSDDAGPFDIDALATVQGANLFVSQTGAYIFETNWSSTTQQAETLITRMAFDTVEGSVHWAAEGTVPGTLLNSFSVGEYMGNLQIATNDWGSGSHVTVLGQVEQRLEKIGSIDNLAPGESLYAARFMGDRAFVVTFRQVDPLFVIDLKDAAHPRVAGELKLPGYSQYLQLIDDTHLVGIGRVADATTGMYQGLQVALFDVADLANPRLQSKYLFEGGRTTFSAFSENSVLSLSDHHAISFFPESGVLALPIHSIENWTGLGENDPILTDPNASQVSVLRVDPESGIHSLGNIAFPNRATRSVRIGKTLYSISPDRVIATELLNPSNKLAEVYFGQGAADDVVEADGGEQVTVRVLRNDGLLAGRLIGRVVSARASSEQVAVEVSDDGSTVTVTPPVGVAGIHTVLYTIDGPDGIRTEGTLRVETPWIWHNSNQPLDVDANGQVSALDALNIVNLLNQHGSSSTEDLEQAVFSAAVGEGENTRKIVQADVNGDSRISALDVLLIVNDINSRITFGNGEAESPDGRIASNSNELPIPQDDMSLLVAMASADEYRHRSERVRSALAAEIAAADQAFADW